MPKTWKEAMLHPLLKKEDNKKYKNYKGIALIYKIFAILIKEGRRKVWSE